MFHTLALLNILYNDWKARFKFRIPQLTARHPAFSQPPLHISSSKLWLCPHCRDLACTYVVNSSHMSKLHPQSPHSCPLAADGEVGLQNMNVGKSSIQILEESSGSFGQEILGTQAQSRTYCSKQF